MVELGLVEQRYQAVFKVLNDGAPITEVAARFGVSRQSEHRRLTLWTLYWPARDSKFHRYENLDPTPTIDRLLAEIDADPICIFWG